MDTDMNRDKAEELVTKILGKYSHQAAVDGPKWILWVEALEQLIEKHQQELRVSNLNISEANDLIEHLQDKIVKKDAEIDAMNGEEHADRCAQSRRLKSQLQALKEEIAKKDESISYWQNVAHGRQEKLCMEIEQLRSELSEREKLLGECLKVLIQAEPELHYEGYSPVVILIAKLKEIGITQ